MSEKEFVVWTGLYGHVEPPKGVVDIKFRDGGIKENESAEEWDWLGGNGDDDIVAFRPIKDTKGE